MNQKTKKQLTHWLSVAVIGITLGFALQFVRAWTEPTATPPGGNVGAPINTSANPQTKAGDFSVSNGRINVSTPSYSSSTLGMAARDINTSNGENLYLNWPNTSGNVYIGGQGDNKDICIWQSGAWKCLSSVSSGGGTTLAPCTISGPHDEWWPSASTYLLDNIASPFNTPSVSSVYTGYNVFFRQGASAGTYSHSTYLTISDIWLAARSYYYIFHEDGPISIQCEDGAWVTR